jgi:hypothetical protein
MIAAYLSNPTLDPDDSHFAAAQRSHAETANATVSSRFDYSGH